LKVKFYIRLALSKYLYKISIELDSFLTFSHDCQIREVSLKFSTLHMEELKQK
jgi:hypothetical protein